MKCGGTSVETAYQDVALFTDLIIGSSPFGEKIQGHYEKQFGVGKHAHAAELKMALGDRWASLRKLAIVRNHFRIHESFYCWIGRIIAYHAKQKGESVDFVRAAVLADSGIFHFEKWGVSKAYCSTRSFPEFLQYIVDHRVTPQESFLDRMGYAENKDSLRVFKLEDMDLFWKAFEEVVGTKLYYLHRNRSHSEQQSFDWPDSVVHALVDRYHDDFEHFGFPKKP